MTTPDLRSTIQSNVRQRALTIAGGISGVSTLAVLAASAVLPLAGFALPPTIAWLSGLGANALAAWLDTWARQQTAQAIGQPDDQAQITVLATALEQQLKTNQPIAEDLAKLLQQGDLVAVAIDGLQGHAAQQTRLLRMLTEDLQQATFRNERLHETTYQEVQRQSQLLLAALTSIGSQLTTQLRDVIAQLGL